MYNNHKIVGLCISRLYGDHSLSLLRALWNALTPHGYKLLVFHTCTDLEWSVPNEYGEETVFKLIPYDILDALIIFDEAFYKKFSIQPILEAAEDHDVPVISIGAQYEIGYSVLFPYTDGFKQVLKHLLDEHEAKDVVMIAGYKGNTYSDVRIDCFRKMLMERSLDYSDNRVYYGDYWFEPTERATQAIIDRDKLPDAIVCVNDFTAITACAYLRSKGIRIPEDIIVTGFDGTKQAEYSVPSITTSTFENDSIAMQVLKILGQITSGQIPSRINNVAFTMKYGASCGCGHNLHLENAGTILKENEERLTGYNDLSRRHYETSERMVRSETAYELISLLEKFHIKDSCIMLNTDWSDISINPTSYHRSEPFTEEMIMVYKDEIPYPDQDVRFPLEKLLPHFDELIEGDRPITFNALNYLGLSIGYLVVYYDPMVYYYGQLVQYTTTFDRAFGDYRNVQYLKNVAASMEHLSNHDSMTGLMNRKGFLSSIQNFVMEARESQCRLLVASVDLDGLKYINDTFGHKAGDYAITTIANAIKSLPMDRTRAARFGGDEFVVCMTLYDSDNPDDLLGGIDEYIDRISEDFEHPFFVSASIGYVIANPFEFDLEETLRESDAKMYAIKSSKPGHRR